MSHYICTGSCHGVSDHPQSCEDESCEMHGEPLQTCDCTDGNHEGSQEQEKEDGE